MLDDDRGRMAAGTPRRVGLPCAPKDNPAANPTDITTIVELTLAAYGQPGEAEGESIDFERGECHGTAIETIDGQRGKDDAMCSGESQVDSSGRCLDLAPDTSLEACPQEQSEFIDRSNSVAWSLEHGERNRCPVDRTLGLRYARNVHERRPGEPRAALSTNL
jgi:hypothetical protein